MSSGGGGIRLSHMSCTAATLDSGGGSVTVDGLEGNATLLSGGGAVKVPVGCGWAAAGGPCSSRAHSCSQQLMHIG